MDTSFSDDDDEASGALVLYINLFLQIALFPFVENCECKKECYA